MVDITPVIPAQKKVIQRYSSTSFTINEKVYEQPILVLPESVHLWKEVNFNDIDSSISNILKNLGEIELLLLGSGKYAKYPSVKTKQLLRKEGVAIEVMDSGAACRTYNILLAEGREVAAALFPSEQA